MPDTTYVPIYGHDCAACGDSPVVGLIEDHCIRSTGFCGPCFFSDRSMNDPERWNEAFEGTE